ncbi:hypothetical protein WISP_102310 [Willisornis vidua]|uniref:CCHC-type domain-containing protein n=1 Tax=Willisornis vidua TaxID=1566151 RepID=A0ABQ9CY50_9PASS|nr:hypothetical protein WISP_102310 [Willisornis vidua]
MTPSPVLHKTAELAFQAIIKVAKTTTSTPSYALIFQGPKEPFYEFATRLKEAIAKQVSNSKSQDILFKSLVVEKANEECRKILQPLKDPTLLDMIEACRNVDYTREDLKMVACAVTGRCFNCQKEGHLERHCPENQPPPSPKTLPRFNCQRCGKGKHWTSLCRSVTDLNGDPLPPKSPKSQYKKQVTFNTPPSPQHSGDNQGNSLQSAKRGAMTANASPACLHRAQSEPNLH